MNIYGSSDIIKIRVCNKTSCTLKALLYQEDLNLTADNYLVGAWRYAPVASGGTLSATLPLNIEVGAADEGSDIDVATKLMAAPQNSKFSMFTDNMGAIDIQRLEDTNTDGSISVTNECDHAEWVKVYKDGAPIFSMEVRPDFKECFKIKPKLTLALVNGEISTAFFDAAQISKKTEVDLSNQSFLTYILTEDQGTKKIYVELDYDRF